MDANPNECKIISDLLALVKQLESGRKVNFDFAQVPVSSFEELNDLKNEMEILTRQYNDNYDFVINIGKGNLNVVPPVKNNYATPYKQLQADLLHLTWQIQQISAGDYEQNVVFSGEFSDSINAMIASLKEKRRVSELNVFYLKELKELNAMKDKFFSIIAHDLKNPFSGLLSLSDLLLMNIREQQYENLEEIASLLKEFSNQGYKLLVNLLEWSRANTNSLNINIEPISLVDVVDKAKAMVLPRAQQKKIRIMCVCPHKYMVMADSNLLDTVMRNLLSNAVKFTAEGGSVTITGEESEQHVVVHISDTGIGIKPENIAKLFRIDTNCSTKGTDNEEGTGLGLILCKDFLAKMDGTISVESVPGIGSVFSFNLPKAVEA